MLSDQLQKEIVEKIVAAVHPAKIILFGSHAYGQPEEESDLDLVIIKDKPVLNYP
ncbi:nucleotidyltransferase domain-containing protein [Geobacter argillaceus]|uniref:Nucleotidyltransferase-like protein n=1 Tax=Geobacter argillaceus TaxID=345631 RepID=A0A562W8S1_9BACT|nr:nucleotidyltransferase domain-containing protein [Geobacter argillaceus]TWJ26347.1 nucleotidyltransferase-like protein [Geobacter argillaceus]